MSQDRQTEATEDTGDSRSSSERIASRFRRDIDSGCLAVGERLPPERAVADELGVARSVVREAFRELRGDGYIISGRGRQGTVVAAGSDAYLGRSLSELMETSVAPLADLNELRMGLEVQAAGLAAWRRIPEDIVAMDEVVAAMATTTDERRMAELDAAFHGAISQAAHNVFYQHLTAHLVRLLRDHIPLMLALYRDAPGSSKQLMLQHQAVATAIRSRDVEGARQSMTAHLTWVVQELQLLDPHTAASEPSNEE